MLAPSATTIVPLATSAFASSMNNSFCVAHGRVVYNPGTTKLSPAALETLAIIAYNQPITTSEVSEMRGVQSGQLIRKLAAKGLLKEAGKSDMPGRPNLYRTTSEFLDYFGLATIDDLPVVETKNKPKEDETELFTSIYKDKEEN